MPKQRNLDVEAGLVIVAGEEEQGKNGGERALGVTCVIPEREGQRGARSPSRKYQNSGATTRWLRSSRWPKKTRGKSTPAAAAVGEVAVVGPQRENAGRGGALIWGMAVKI